MINRQLSETRRHPISLTRNYRIACLWFI